MFIYKYTREILEGNGYNINNSFRKDSAGNQIYLSKEVSDLLPEKKFILYCNDGIADFMFKTELNDEEKQLLDTCVYNHKNNL